MYIQINAKNFKWNLLKSERLKRARGVSFEELIKAKVVEIKNHPSRENQRMMLFDYKGYIWLVPFIENNEGIFLKTLYQSRKYTEIFRKKGVNDESNKIDKTGAGY